MAYRLVRAKWIPIGIVVLVVVALASWRIWSRVNDKPASDSLHHKVKKLVERHPRLQGSYDRAMSDGVLTLREAQAIIDEIEG